MIVWRVAGWGRGRGGEGGAGTVEEADSTGASAPFCESTLFGLFVRLQPPT